jgi:hypothetical protein
MYTHYTFPNAKEMSIKFSNKIKIRVCVVGMEFSNKLKLMQVCMKKFNPTCQLLKKKFQLAHLNKGLELFVQELVMFSH